MTITEELTRGMQSQKAYGVVILGLDEIPPASLQRSRTPGYQWIDYTLPLAEEDSSCQIAEVTLVEPGIVFPRTALGKRLADLRSRAIESGMKLLSKDEILEEIRRRRGETDNNEANLH